MLNKTVTCSIETETMQDQIMEVLADPGLIPRWAPGFADKVESEDRQLWKVTKGESTFQVELVVVLAAGTVDYVREVAAGKKGGAYLRVLPRPGGGSVIVMTLPVPAGVPPAEVAATLDHELRLLTELCVSRSAT